MRYITATNIFSGINFLNPNSVLVIDDKNSIIDIILKQDTDASNIVFFDGILCPGFINTHCHLELSHLKNKIKPQTGIVNFGLSVIKNRNAINDNLQIEFMLKADNDMYLNGIVAVGDISNSTLSIKAKQQSKLYYHTFVELIALNPNMATSVFNAGKLIANEFTLNNLSVSLSPHAPYSTSLPLINQITNYCNQLNKPTAIHNQESCAENDFFKSKTGDYLRLYNTLNIPINYFEPTNTTSLQTVITSLNSNINTLLVHNTFTNSYDIEFTKSLHQKLFWCLCPNANLYIENTLPDIDLLVEQNCNLTIGTDSLASNLNLSIVEEINTLLTYMPNLKTETLLKAATYNGAKFLGIDNKFGLIEKNKAPGINLIKKVNDKFEVKKLIDIN